MGYHNILGSAFAGLHGQTKSNPALNQGEGEELVLFSETLMDSSSSGMYHKILRVKSSKTYEWLANEASVFHLFVTVAAVSQLERCMYKFMQWQQEDSCFATNEQTPLMRMANIETSPAATAVRHLVYILKTGKLGTQDVHYEDFVSGLGHLLLITGSSSADITKIGCKIKEATYL